MKERRKYPTVLRYPGGKSRIIYYLFRKNMIPQEIKEYREGFLGGGSCALAFSVMYPDIPVWVNDLYYNLYCFWTQLQTNPDSLVNRLLELKDKACEAEDVTQLEEKHRQLYSDMRDLIDTSTDPFDIATSFYILNRSSFGGFTEQNKNAFIRDSYKNTIFSQSKIKKLSDISTIIQPWRITNQDYRDLMTDPGQDVFVFLDPPYDIKDFLYGKDREMHKNFDHHLFADHVDGCLHKFMITYNVNDWLEERYKNYYQRYWKLQYGMVHRQNNKKTELLVTNYNCGSPLEALI